MRHLGESRHSSCERPSRHDSRQWFAGAKRSVCPRLDQMVRTMQRRGSHDHQTGCAQQLFIFIDVTLPARKTEKHAMSISAALTEFHLSPSPSVPPVIRHCDELPWAAGLLGYGFHRCWIGNGRGRKPPPSGAGDAYGDACRSTRDNRNPSTAGAPKSPCFSAGTASAYRSFGCPGNHHIWRHDRSTGRAAMRGGCGRRSDQSVTRSAVRSGRTPARTSSS